MGSILLVASDVWAAALRTAGHDVLSAATLADAPSLVREGGIDVIVIDSDDPSGTLELAHTIEALPDAPPIILVSASPAAPEVSARIGAATFLPRPCDPAELVEVIARVVGHLRPVRTFEDEPTGRTHVG